MTSRPALCQTTPYCAKKLRAEGTRPGRRLRERIFCEANAQYVLSDRSGKHRRMPSVERSKSLTRAVVV
jgi:hypothetical protein